MAAHCCETCGHERGSAACRDHWRAENCATCGHDRVFHQIGRGTGVPIGVNYCDDRHDAPCDCKGFVQVYSKSADVRDATSWEQGLCATRDATPWEQDHAALVAYLLSAARRKDWRAVSDAANDLRVLEASRR